MPNLLRCAACNFRPTDSTEAEKRAKSQVLFAKMFRAPACSVSVPLCTVIPRLLIVESVLTAGTGTCGAVLKTNGYEKWAELWAKVYDPYAVYMLLCCFLLIVSHTGLFFIAFISARGLLEISQKTGWLDVTFLSGLLIYQVGASLLVVSEYIGYMVLA